MVNYDGAFSQSESGKYFEWIIMTLYIQFILSTRLDMDSYLLRRRHK